MFRLQSGGRPPSRESRDVEGVEVPDIRSEHRPPMPFYPSGDRPRYRRENVFKPLTYLGPGPKALRSHPRGCVMPTGVQNEDISAPCGLPLRSRITEVRGYQKTFSVSSRVERTTMPFSETSSSGPAGQRQAGPKYTITSCPTQASGICSAIDPPSGTLPSPYGHPTLGVGLRAR
jgi:hypothetical protein